jgi:hypothetical protein
VIEEDTSEFITSPEIKPPAIIIVEAIIIEVEEEVCYPMSSLLDPESAM